MTAGSDDDIRREVEELLVRYAASIDRKDWALLRRCFTADCHADYGEVGVWEGVEAIVDYMARTHPQGVRTLHRISNLEVWREGDGASARSYVDALFVRSETGRGVRAAGTYDDELARSEDGWRIARRRYAMVHMAPLRGL